MVMHMHMHMYMCMYVTRACRVCHGTISEAAAHAVFERSEEREREVERGR